ncbi:MAG TPA: hypothetical protein VGD52_15690, partial [Pseudoduganella sp.]
YRGFESHPLRQNTEKAPMKIGAFSFSRSEFSSRFFPSTHRVRIPLPNLHIPACQSQELKILGFRFVSPDKVRCGRQ